VPFGGKPEKFYYKSRGWHWHACGTNWNLGNSSTNGGVLAIVH